MYLKKTKEAGKQKWENCHPLATYEIKELKGFKRFCSKEQFLPKNNCNVRICDKGSPSYVNFNNPYMYEWDL